MKIATYNIASGYNFEDFAKTGKPTFDLMKTAAFIKGFGADVITLNEIASQYNTKAGRINEVTQIAECCEYAYSQFARGTIFSSGRDLGNTILSNYPILESKVIHVLAPTEEERRPDENSWYEDRVILCCILEAFGTKIRYITTHFGLNKLEKERMMSALCDMLAESDMPTILSGDFNELPHSDILQPLYEKYRSVADVMGVNECTLCEPMEQPLTVDHIFVSDHFDILEYRVLKRVLSDHYPCTAKLRLK